MARTLTRKQIRDAARSLADQENSTFITDYEANLWVDQSLAELWDMLVSADPDRYIKTQTINAVQGTKSYALASDFYQSRAVNLVLGSEEITIEPFQLAEKNRYRRAQIYNVPDAIPDVRYRIMGQGIDGSDSKVYFDSDPGGRTYKIYYVQAPQRLTTDSSTFDGVAGWEEWTIYDVAIRMMAKEESDPSVLMADRQRIEQRIKAMAHYRDSGRAPRIQDTRTAVWRGPSYR